VRYELCVKGLQAFLPVSGANNELPSWFQARPLSVDIFDQKTRPMRATTVRGCKKCVPLNVERKL
jgi:hypothetical protein